MVDITTGTGDFVANGVVSHNCFARGSHEWLELDTGTGFDREIVVKVNIVDVLHSRAGKAFLDPRAGRPGHEYRPVPARRGPLSPDARHHRRAGRVRHAAVDLDQGSVAAPRPPARRSGGSRRPGVGRACRSRSSTTPCTISSSPVRLARERRLDLVRAVRDHGLPCRVMLAPVLPWLTDSEDELDQALGAIAAAGATGATVMALHLKPATKRWFMGWLGRERPDLVRRYEELYGAGTYVPKSYRDMLAARAAPLLRRHGLTRRRGRPPVACRPV